MIFICPVCESTSLAIEVGTWCNYHNNRPSEFDDEDVPYVEPKHGGEWICRDCQATGIIDLNADNSAVIPTRE